MTARPPDDPRRVLARYDLRAKKSWGQNFLVARGIHQRIVAAAGATADDVVVEIGAGLGTLTVALASAEPPPRRVIAVERDPDMLTVLRGELVAAANVEVAAADAATYDLPAVARGAGRPIIVVGNLPYQISSALLLRLARAGTATLARAVVMVQREMAQRVVAPAGNKIYGRFSVAVQQRAAVRILFHVSPGAFHPPPQVTSSVLELLPRAALLAPVRDELLFDEVVKEAFGTRRKMLRRALAPAFGADVAEAALQQAGLDGTLRAEALTIAELARLADGMLAARAAVR
ncbi:MAG TPA: 16S rRNA (adenine(1518)-N(6)/adenine(1519)-N(6))-dimethyltransferase RsmA [Polyangia bacterium]|nr:16S rRNA (adenine(1518)-N(6)/adenine(1519)-N(6))-dimethyltransferase RsmA [Polyangia bacterium]